MDRRGHPIHPQLRAATRRLGTLGLALGAAGAFAQGVAPAAPPAQPTSPAPSGWQQCAALGTDGPARLACFDRWAATQQPASSSAALAATSAVPATVAAAPSQPASPVDATLPATRVIGVAMERGCDDTQYSQLSRFWELEAGTSCGALKLRGYRANTLSIVGSDTVNRQPTSGNSANSALTSTDYRTTETRLQLSVRTKVTENLLTAGHPTKRDSLWVGYTQQSYWQLFTSDLSRPFRSTDHEPEVVYVYPTDTALPGGWRWRYAGAGLVHQSNGQSLPLSRSWNRAYLMTGLELGDTVQLTGRVWKRIADGNGGDDNPGISDFIGRGELGMGWNVNRDNRLMATVRGSFSGTDRGSVRLEWMRAVGGKDSFLPGGLRLHTQLFSGYGDSLIDYNKKRNVLSVGLSLVDF